MSEQEREIIDNFLGMFCSRCGTMFDEDAEAEDHLNGPMCEPQSK